MTTEQNESTNEAQTNIVPQPPVTNESLNNTQQNKEKSFSESDVEKIIQERLKNKEMEHKRKMEDAKSRIAELEGKVNSGTATHAEQMELNKGKTSAANAVNAGVPPEAIPYIMDEQMANEKFKQKISSAADTDPQFKQLLQQPGSERLVHEDQRFFLRDLENAPAVLKKLMTDKRENNMMQAKFQEMIAHRKPSIMVDYINQLSEKLEKSAVKPRASSFSPAPDISDFGDSSQDFDIKSYVKTHR